MISPPVSSIFACSPLPLGLGELQACPFPWCCLPTPSFVGLVFFPVSLCLARWFWPVLMNGRHVHTTAVCVSLRWLGGLRGTKKYYQAPHNVVRGKERCLMLRETGIRYVNQEWRCLVQNEKGDPWCYLTWDFYIYRKWDWRSLMSLKMGGRWCK